MLLHLQSSQNSKNKQDHLLGGLQKSTPILKVKRMQGWWSLLYLHIIHQYGPQTSQALKNDKLQHNQSSSNPVAATIVSLVFVAVVQSLSRVWLFVTLWTAARQASLSITNSQSLPKLRSIESVMPSNHLILCRPLLLLPCLSCVSLLRPFGLQPSRLLCPWDFSSRKTGVGCHFPLQEMFPTQESNRHLPCLLHYSRCLYPLSHLGCWEFKNTSWC